MHPACTLLLGDEVELLADAPRDHRVVAIESECNAFAVEDFVAHVRVHQ
jgi:hypothetical protein